MTVGNIILGHALRDTLLSLNRTQDVIDDTVLRLATGLKVNSAVDLPQNFFASRSLKFSARDYTELLDGIGQSQRTIEEALIGAEALDRLINQTESIVLESKEIQEAGGVDPLIYTEEIDLSPPPLHNQILNSAPDVYYQLNETGGPIIDYGTAGGVNATYTGGASAGAAALYNNGSQPSVNFDGVNDHISVADSNFINVGTFPARTVELVFNADGVTGRQILFEEGAGVNGLTIYLDPSATPGEAILRITGEDDQGGQRWANANINTTIQEGQTYHVAMVYDGANTDFIGYLDGVEIGRVDTNGATTFPSHTGDVHIGGSNDSAQYHDGEGPGSAFHFDGRISNVAIYNRALGDTELFRHAEALNSSTTTKFRQSEYEALITAIDDIVIDAQYRGINLLNGDNLRTDFKEDRSDPLITKGRKFDRISLGLQRLDFNVIDNLNTILDSVREAREEIREYARSLTSSLNIIDIREQHTRERINTLLAGADDLTVADQNKEGANLLASQTRLALGVTALSLAGSSQRQVLRLF